MWMDKKQKLKASYYRSFFSLIVIPILFVIFLSIIIIRTMMVDFAIRNIRRAQENLVTNLEGEVKDVSLRLSHFVYVNDNEIMRNAARTNTRDMAEKYHYAKLLEESFHYAMAPMQDILSAIFYMKDGDSIYMKDNIILPDQEIKEASWYQDALQDKNIVKTGYYNTNVTYSKRNAHTLTIAAAYSPDIDVDRDGRVEMAVLFVSSRFADLVKEYNKEELLGATLLLDSNGYPVFDPVGAVRLLPRDGCTDNDEIFYSRVNGTKYVYVVSEEPLTSLRIVSVVSAGVLVRDFNRVAAAIVGVTIVLFTLFYLFSSYFLRDIIEPIHNTVEGMKAVEEGNLEVQVEPKGQAELRTMIHSFNRMTRRLNRLIEENKEQTLKKHEAEIRALQSQINPHFLVNALNSIRFIAQISKFDSIARMAESLIKILSCSFRSNAEFYTLKEELEVLDGFIYLMKIRYSDGFDISYEVEDACKDCLLPRLILQPVVENSIVHGFSGYMEEIGQIKLSVREDKGFLIIEVWDNGIGMEEEEMKGILNQYGRDNRESSSIGLMNVNTRLSLNYGKDGGFIMESVKGEFTRSILRLPARHEEKDSGQ